MRTLQFNQYSQGADFLRAAMSRSRAVRACMPARAWPFGVLRAIRGDATRRVQAEYEVAYAICVATSCFRPTNEPCHHVQHHRAIRSYYQPRREMKPPTARGASAASRVCTARRRSPRSNGAHVAVIGIGGVGSWVAEALARSAVGKLTLIDLDNVAESNTNRQIHALDGNYGKPKVEAMAERIAADRSVLRRARDRGLRRAGQLRRDARRRLRLRDRCDRQRAHQDRVDRMVRGAADSR